MLVMMPVALGGTLAGASSIAEGITALCLILWGIRVWLVESHRFFFSPGTWFVLAFALYAFISYLTSPIEYEARSVLFNALLYAAVFFIFINNLRGHKQTNFIAISVCLTGSLIAIYAIIQFITDSTSILGYPQPEVYLHRASGTYICPNHFAGYLEMLIPLALALTFAARIGPVLRVLLGFGTIIMLCGLAVTISRAGYFSCVIALTYLLVVFYKLPKYRLVSIITAVLVLAGGSIFLMGKENVETRFSQLAQISQLQEGRAAIYQASLKLVTQSPILGIGLGSYQSRVGQFLSHKIQADPIHAHSDFLELLIEWGIIGLAIVLGFCAVTAYGGIQIWDYIKARNNTLALKSSSRTALFLGVSAGLLAIFIHSFVDFNMQLPANALLAVTLLAVLTSMLRHVTDRYWIRLNTAIRLSFTILVLVLSSAFSWHAVHSYIQDYALQYANQTDSKKMNSFDLLSFAHSNDSRNWKVAKALVGRMINTADMTEDTEEKNKTLLAALNIAQKTIPFNPYDMGLQMYVAIILTELERFNEAKPFSEKALLLAPNNYWVNAHYGWCALYARDFQTATTYLEKSIHLKNEDNDFAKEWYQIALKRLEDEKKFD